MHRLQMLGKMIIPKELLPIYTHAKLVLCPDMLLQLAEPLTYHKRRGGRAVEGPAAKAASVAKRQTRGLPGC